MFHIKNIKISTEKKIRVSGNPITQKHLLLNFCVCAPLIESSFWHPTSRAAIWTRSPPTLLLSLTDMFPIEDNIRCSRDGKLSINNEWRVTPCLFYKPPSPGAPLLSPALNCLLLSTPIYSSLPLMCGDIGVTVSLLLPFPLRLWFPPGLPWAPCLIRKHRRAALPIAPLTVLRDWVFHLCAIIFKYSYP